MLSISVLFDIQAVFHPVCLAQVASVDIVSQNLEVRLEWHLEWYDERRQYHNLADDPMRNVFNQLEGLWIPALVARIFSFFLFLECLHISLFFFSFNKANIHRSKETFNFRLTMRSPCTVEILP